MNPPRDRPVREQAFLEVTAVAVIIVHGGLTVLRKFGQRGQEVMGDGSAALQSLVLHLGKLLAIGVVSSMGQQRKLSRAGAGRGASQVDLSLVLSEVKGRSRSIAGASAFSSEPLRPFASQALRYRPIVGKEKQ
jgi:hypothetical protein